MTLRGVRTGAVLALVTLLVIGPVAQAAQWQPVATPSSDLLRAVSFFDADKGVAVGTGHTVLVTDDGGSSWRQTDGGRFGFGWYDAEWASPTTVYAVGANAVFQPTVALSQNGGQSWSWETFYINNNEGTLHGVAVSLTHVLVAATLWNGDGVILQKPLVPLPLPPAAQVLEWTPVLTVPEPIVGIDADGLLAVAVGASGTVYTSRSAGLAWTPAVTPTDAHLYDVAVAYPNALAVGADGTVIRSSDEGLTWESAASGTDVTLQGVGLTPSGQAVLAGDGGVVGSSADAGATWVVEESGLGVGFHGADAADGLTESRAWAVGARGAVAVRSP